MGAFVCMTAVALGGTGVACEGLAAREKDAAKPAASTGAVRADPTDGPVRASYLLPGDPALASPPVAATIDPERPYSLADLLDLAHKINPRARIAGYEARNAVLDTDAVRSSYAPKISFTAAASAQASHSALSAPGFDAGGDGHGEGGVAAISLDWLLFDFGVRDALLRAARQRANIANLAFTAEHQQVTHQVALAFYDDVAARARSANADRAEALAAQVQAAAEARLRQGVGSTVEVAQARQATAQSRFNVVQAQAGVTDTRSRLLEAVGLPPFTRLQIADPVDRALTLEMADLAEQAVASALSRRPDMLAALAGESASQEGVRVARAEFSPKVFASGVAARSGGDHSLSALPGLAGEPPTLNISGSRTSGALMVGVRLPLFDGGLRAARLEQARNRVRAAEAKLEATRNRAVLEIVAAKNGLRSAIAATAAADDARAAAQTTFEAAFAAYERGVGSVTEANLARLQMLAADNAVEDAHAAVLKAATTLALATGALDGAPGSIDEAGR